MSKKGRKVDIPKYESEPTPTPRDISVEDKEHLLALQWLRAEQGDTKMLIWLGKQYLGQGESDVNFNYKPYEDIVCIDDNGKILE